MTMERQIIAPALPASTGASGPRIGLSDLGWLIRRQFWPMVIVIILVMGATTAILMRTPNSYTSTAAMALTVSETRVSRANSQLEAFDVTSARVQTEIDILRSRDFAASVAESLNLFDNKAFIGEADPNKLTPEQKAAVLDRLLASYTIYRTGESLVLNVTATADSPELAAGIANTVVTAYITRSSRDDQVQLETWVSFLRNRVEQLGQDLSESEQALGDIIRSNNLDDASLPTKLLAERNNAADIIAVLQGDPRNAEEIARRQEALELYEEQLAARTRAELARKRQERVVDLLATRYQTATERLNELEPQLDFVSQSARQVTMAEVPTRPSFPNRPATLAVAFAGSFILAFLVALLLNSMSRQVWSSEQAREITGLPTMGNIPRVRSRGAMQLRMPGWVLMIPRFSAFAESLRALLTILTNSSNHRGKRVLMVTSPMQREGKSTIAASLAVTAARDGLGVLLVDLDQRRPETFRLLGVTGQRVNIEDLLMKRLPLSDAIQKVEDGNGLSLLALNIADRWNPRMVEQFGEKVLKPLREEYDLIIFDTPPAMLSADTGRLGGLADEALVVVSMGKTSTRALAAAVERLIVSGVNVVGTVINSIEHNRGGIADHGGSGRTF
ncbi:GumC family protein [Paracoccus fontiphilus]|nr:polysaccharide biosynthesis tyrosine autokinase [Paracoccus fontiphilus]